MEGLEFYGATPAYGELYYNLHAETAWCLDELDKRFSAERRAPIAFVSDEPILSRKVAIGALKLYSARQKQSSTKVIWLDIFPETKTEDLWESAQSALIDIWFGSQATGIDHFERRLISTGAFSSEERSGLHTNAAKILDQMSGAKIVFVLDLRDTSHSGMDALIRVVQSLDSLVARQSNNLLAVVILGPSSLAIMREFRALDTAFAPISLDIDETASFLELLDSKNLRDSGFSQANSALRHRKRTLDSNASIAATPLILVNDPILKPALEYLSGISTERNKGMASLGDEGAIEPLRNGGVALTNFGIFKYSELPSRSPKEEIRSILEANSAKMLSAAHPKNFQLLDVSMKRIEEALAPRSSVVENVAACIAARIGQSQVLAGDLGDHLLDILRAGGSQWAASELPLLDRVLNYLSLVAFREPDLFDRFTFKLAEEMTYALNAHDFGIGFEHSPYLKAQRITRLIHLYNNAPAAVRRRIGGLDTKRYSRQAIEVLSAPVLPFSSEGAYRSSYLAGWLLHDLGESERAEARLAEAAAIAQHRAIRESGLSEAIYDKSLGFELTIQALFFSKRPEVSPAVDLIPGYLNDHGVVTSIQDILELANSHLGGRKAVPGKAATPDDRWHIIFDRLDFASAIMIAGRLLFDWRHPVELICVSDREDVGAVVDGCPGRRVVLGAPDSPGSIGVFVRKQCPDFSKLWQIRFNESFYQPILLRDRADKPPTVILVGSIAGDILHAWSKFVVELEPLKQRKRDILMLALLGSMLPTILTTASKKLTEMFIDKLVNSVENKLDPKNRVAAGGELLEVKRALENASNSDDAAEAGRKLNRELDRADRSRLVLTGLMDAIESPALYAQLEAMLTGLASLEHSTNLYRDMAALLQILSLQEHHRSDISVETSKKLRNFADGFSNLKSRFDDLLEEYETKAKWNAESRNQSVNDLITTGQRFFAFARSLQ